MLVREVAGVQTAELLPEILRGLLAEFAFAKSMKWGCNSNTFARPVQWLLALYGQDVVNLSFNGIVSSRSSRGHRFMAPGDIEIQGASSYEQQLACGPRSG